MARFEDSPSHASVARATSGRILVAHGDARIQAECRRILAAEPSHSTDFELASAGSAEAGLERVREALAAGRPFALALIEVQATHADGLVTLRRILELDRDLQVVISSPSPAQLPEELLYRPGWSERLLILNTPFESFELLQLAQVLTKKWNSEQRERSNQDELRRAQQEARSYAASIRMVKRALESATVGAEARSAAAAQFLERLAAVLQESSAALYASLELACESGQDDEVRSASLAAASERCRELCNTARNLSLHAGLERQSLEPLQVRFSPGQLLDESVARWRERAQASGLRFVCECPSPLPRCVHGDPEIVAGVLDALVDNALRFTPAGVVRLSASLPVRDEGEEPQLVFSVSDSGPGIPVEQQPQAFEAFARGAGWAGRGEGAHLSLHMARRLARALGGDLECECSPDKGCCFRFQIPAGDLAGVEFGLHPPAPLPSSEAARTPGEARR